MQKYLFLLLFFSLSQCANSSLQEELKSTEATLLQVQKELAQTQELLKNVNTEQGDQLIHLVFFKVKPSANLDSLVTQIKTLANIEVVKQLEVGPFEELGDPRALSEYQLLMQLTFDNADDYEIYQQHPVHKALQQYAKDWLAGPPTTYDFRSK